MLQPGMLQRMASEKHRTGSSHDKAEQGLPTQSKHFIRVGRLFRMVACSYLQHSHVWCLHTTFHCQDLHKRARAQEIA